jgi:hypothetical protein
MPNDTGRKPPMTGAERSRKWRERHRQGGSASKKSPEAAAALSATPAYPGIGEFDPLEVLRSIAVDPAAPAAARVAACRTLVQHETHSAGPPTRKLDELAIQFLRRVN